MRVLRLMVLIIGMLGGTVGLSASVNAAPMPVSGIGAETSQAPLVARAYYYFVRRRYYRPRYYFRPRYYRSRHYYRPRYYRRSYYRPRFYRRRFFF